MATLLFYIVSFICILLVVAIYWLFIAQKDVPPMEVFKNLLYKLNETPRAFTYKFHSDTNLYENYTLQDATLAQTMDPHPVNYDGTPYLQSNKHGIIIEKDDRFTITNVDIDFTCPTGWYYSDKKCQVRNVCQTGDIDVYRGINYYYFKEKILQTQFDIQSMAYHPRLYFYCNRSEQKLHACPDNELFIGQSSLPANQNPCRPYDLCADRLEMTRHRFQIDDHILADNEYYVCNNGVSVLKYCPVNTSLSTLTNTCVQVNRCFDKTGTLPLDNNRFIFCQNNTEIIVDCPSGIFNIGNQLECKNPQCNQTQIQNTTLPNLRFPSGIWECKNNMGDPTNSLILRNCSDEFSFVAGPDNQNTNIPYTKVKPLAPPIQMPVLYLNENQQCAPFVMRPEYQINPIVMGSLNDGLPQVQVNIFENVIQFNMAGTKFYRNKDKIFKMLSVGDNEFEHEPVDGVTAIDYANFTIVDDFSIFKYKRDVVTPIYGDQDFVTFAIEYDMSVEIPYRVPTDLQSYKDSDGAIISVAPNYWNAYLNTTSSFENAHATEIDQLPFDNSFIYQYKILNVLNEKSAQMLTWTKFGLVKLAIEIDPTTCYFDENNLISHKTLPETKYLVQHNGTTFYGRLTNIKDKEFLLKHIPLCLQFVVNFSVLAPTLAKDTPALFDVIHENYYVQRPMTDLEYENLYTKIKSQ